MDKKFVRMVIKDSKGAILAMAEKREESMIWNLPGGKVDKGETPAEAVIREVKEELNISVSSVKHLYDDTFTFGEIKWQGSFYEAVKHDSNLAIMEPHKCVGYGFFTKDALNILDGPKDVLVKPIERM